MLAKPTQEELNKLARLSLDEFKPVKTFLERELAECYSKLVTIEDANKLARFQGRAALITEFLSLVEKSRDLI